MPEVLTIGEPMGLFVAEEVKPLKEVEHFTRLVCGAEVNFSIGVSRLEHSVAYVSRVGKDPLGEHICDFLKESNIETKYISQDEYWLTGMQMKEKREDGGDPYVANFRRSTAFSHFDVEELKKIEWQGVKHVHTTGIPAALSENCLEALKVLMKEAKAHGCSVSFDPNLRPALWKTKEIMIKTLNELAGLADIILPGVGEAEILMGSKNPDEIADFYFNKGVSKIVIKLGGSKGAYAKEKGGEAKTVPSFKVEKVVDTVGAGDGFAVGTITALLEGKSIAEAARRGAAIGALAVQVAGDNEGLPTREQLKKYMEA